jgi:hypothetical protein
MWNGPMRCALDRGSLLALLAGPVGAEPAADCDALVGLVEAATGSSLTAPPAAMDDGWCVLDGARSAGEGAVRVAVERLRIRGETAGDTLLALEIDGGRGAGHSGADRARHGRVAARPAQDADRVGPSGAAAGRGGGPALGRDRASGPVGGQRTGADRRGRGGGAVGSVAAGRAGDGPASGMEERRTDPAPGDGSDGRGAGAGGDGDAGGAGVARGADGGDRGAAGGQPAGGCGGGAGGVRRGAAAGAGAAGAGPSARSRGSGRSSWGFWRWPRTRWPPRRWRGCSGGAQVGAGWTPGMAP